MDGDCAAPIGDWCAPPGRQGLAVLRGTSGNGAVSAAAAGCGGGGAGRRQSCRQPGGGVMPCAGVGVHGEPWGWPVPLVAARSTTQRAMLSGGKAGSGPSCGGGGRGDARRSGVRLSAWPFALGRLSRARTALLRVPAGRWRSSRPGGRPGARKWGRRPRPG